MRTQLDNNLPRPRRLEQPFWSVHDVSHRVGTWNARENKICLLADFRWRVRRHAADFFEVGKRAAAIAEHAVPALDQVLGDRKSNLAYADKTDSFHSAPRI